MFLPKINSLNPFPALKRFHQKGISAVGAGLFSACLPIMLVAVPTSAHATAEGWQYWGKYCYADFCMPGGSLYHKIVGTGLHVSEQRAGFSAYGNVCNWRIDFNYYDVPGTLYRRYQGPTNYNCKIAGSRLIYPNFWAKSGKSCATLYSNGRKIVSQCHSIHP